MKGPVSAWSCEREKPRPTEDWIGPEVVTALGIVRDYCEQFDKKGSIYVVNTSVSIPIAQRITM